MIVRLLTTVKGERKGRAVSEDARQLDQSGVSLRTPETCLGSGHLAMEFQGTLSGALGFVVPIADTPQILVTVVIAPPNVVYIDGRVQT